MTENTLFDMASLSKNLSTSTSIMQLYEAGKVTSFDDPVQKYLPAFNPTNDPVRAEVTLRMLLTHTSGEPPDINLKDPWGLAHPDKAEGIERALTTQLISAPGEIFRYSDVNFILLGDIVETLSGESLDVYAQTHIFQPLGMTDTRYLPLAKACGPHRIIGAAVAWAPKHKSKKYPCIAGDWNTSLLSRIAPEAHDDESKSNPSANPDFDRLLRGTVHDPTTRRMGGVAGHAGVFSTAHDISLFAQALLDRLAGRPSNFPLQQSTLLQMTAPQQPGHYAGQLTLANTAEQSAIVMGEKGASPLLAPRYPAIHHQDLRGYGWDIDTAFSKPRGLLFPIGSFGHTGFTGTSLWMDPGSDTYIVLLANAIHPRGNAPISNLRGEVATAAAQTLHLYTNEPGAATTEPGAPSSARPDTPASSTNAEPRQGGVSGEARPASRYPEASGSGLISGAKEKGLQPLGSASPDTTTTLTGIDVLESTHFAALTSLAAQHNNTLRLGILTNQTGLDAHGRRTIDILATDLPKVILGAHLATLFTPEHGIFGKQDTTAIAAETDPATGLHVTSLYGAHDSDRRPSHDQLKDLDAVVIDLQDAGVRTYTYEAITGYFLEAAAHELHDFHHDLQIIVLDRPNPIDGLAVEGPVSDPGLEDYNDYTQVPLRHGMTLGELARFYNGSKDLGAPLTVIPMQHWSRSEFYDQTGLLWVDPSPNLHNLTATALLPALTLLETTNVSVGRGTSTPFELFGAGLPARDAKTGEQSPAWFHAAEVAAALNARHLPGVTFSAVTTPVDNDRVHPFHGQTIEAVRINLDTVQARNTLDSPELSIEILSALHRLYPTRFHLDRAMRFLANAATMQALERGDDPRSIAASWQPALDKFRAARQPFLLYPPPPD
jgi:uncharacterized protein YbbC (DUF1343 family)/CubicO group peptidase (beta-lactamase class C family)